MFALYFQLHKEDYKMVLSITRRDVALFLTQPLISRLSSFLMLLFSCWSVKESRLTLFSVRANPHTTALMHVALIAQLREQCTGITEVVGSNPAQSLNFFQVSVLVVLRPHLH